MMAHWRTDTGVNSGCLRRAEHHAPQRAPATVTVPSLGLFPSSPGERRVCESEVASGHTAGVQSPAA